MNSDPPSIMNLAARRRPAFTLAEIAVVVALISILLAFVTSFIVGLHQYDSKFRKDGVRRAQLARMAETIRTDIRQASAVSLPTGQTLLVSTEGGREIRLKIVPEGIRRTVSEPGAAPSADLFRIGPIESWSIDTGPPGRRPLSIVSLRDKRKVDSEPATVALLVQAAIGADRTQGTSDAN